jgi:hypothetical protein
MGSCYAKDVIDRGMSWLGYTEGPGENENFFGKELTRINYFNGDKSNVEWCLSFLCYILTASCFTDDTPADDRPLIDQKWDGLYFTYQPTHDNCACGARYAADYYRQNDAWYSAEDAKPGDWIFFGPRGAETHGELVRYVEDGRIYTVGGNKNNQVQTADYAINYTRISGVGRPRYDGYEVGQVPVKDESSSGHVLTDAVIEDLARRCIEGEFGNYPLRKQKINALGYGPIYSKVQSRVNMIVYGR